MSRHGYWNGLKKEDERRRMGGKGKQDFAYMCIAVSQYQEPWTPQIVVDKQRARVL